MDSISLMVIWLFRLFHVGWILAVHGFEIDPVLSGCWIKEHKIGHSIPFLMAAGVCGDFFLNQVNFTKIKCTDLNSIVWWVLTYIHPYNHCWNCCAQSSGPQ